MNRFYVIEFVGLGDEYRLVVEKGFRTRESADKFCAMCYKAHPGSRFRVVADDEEI